MLVVIAADETHTLAPRWPHTAVPRAGLASHQHLDGFLQYCIGMYGLLVAQTDRRALDGVSAAPEPKSLLQCRI